LVGVLIIISIRKMNEDDLDASKRKRRRKEVISLYEKGNFLEARSKIFLLPQKEQNHGSMIMANADCLYEEGDDLNALREYLRYLELFPKGKAKNYVLFGIAMILKNLDLQKEAFNILKLVDHDHCGLGKEKEESLAILEKQKEATIILSSLISGNQ